MYLVAQTLLPSTVNWRDRGAIAANHLDVTMRRIVLTGGLAYRNTGMSCPRFVRRRFADADDAGEPLRVVWSSD